MFTDLMIDMETCDTVATAALLSIGIVPFNLRTGQIATDHHLYLTIDLHDQLPQRTISESTMKWWRDQGDTAASRAVWKAPDKRQLSDVLDETYAFCNNYPKAEVWSNGASFDIPMLEHAYASYGKKAPWKYTAATCMRTWRKLPGAKAVPYPEFVGTPHNALDDAMQQAKHVIAIHRTLFPTNTKLPL